MLASSPGGVVIDIRVTPRGRKSELSGMRGGALHVRLAAPPVDGAANDALIEVMAAALHVPRRSVSIVAGAASRRKRVQVMGIDVETAVTRLTRCITP